MAIQMGTGDLPLPFLITWMLKKKFKIISPEEAEDGQAEHILGRKSCDKNIVKNIRKTTFLGCLWLVYKVQLILLFWVPFRIFQVTRALGVGLSCWSLMIWVAYLRDKGDGKVTILNYYGMASRTKFDIELVPNDAKRIDVFIYNYKI